MKPRPISLCRIFLACAFSAQFSFMPRYAWADAEKNMNIVPPPGNLDVYVDCGGTRVSLSWRSPVSGSEITGYNIYRGKSLGDLKASLVNKAPVRDNFFVDEYIKANEYFYRVTSITKGGKETPLKSAAVVSAEKAVEGEAGWPLYGRDLFQSHGTPSDIGDSLTLFWSYTSTAGLRHFGEPVLIDAGKTQASRVCIVENVSGEESCVLSLDAKTGEQKSKWNISGTYVSQQINPDGALFVIMRDPSDRTTAIVLPQGEPAKPWTPGWTLDTRGLVPLAMGSLSTGRPEDGLLFLTSKSGGEKKHIVGFDRDGSRKWSLDIPQPHGRMLHYASSAVGCDGRIFLSGNELEGKKPARAFLQVIRLPSAVGPVVDYTSVVPAVLCDKAPTDMSGGPVLLSPDMTFAAQMYETLSTTCTPERYHGLIVWDLATATPFDDYAFNDPDLNLTSDSYGGVVYAKLRRSGAAEPLGHVLAGTQNGQVFDLSVSEMLHRSIAVGGPVETMTAPVVSADRFLLVGDSSGVASIIDISSQASPFVHACFAFPAGTRIDGQPTVGPDGMWCVVTNSRTIFAFKNPGLSGASSPSPGLQPSGPSGGGQSEESIKVELPHYLWDIGGLGQGNGQLKGPEDVAAMSGGTVAVADTGNSRVQLFTSEGSLVRVIGRFGSSEGYFKKPGGIAAGDGLDSNIYVADTMNNRIQILSADGSVVSAFGQIGSSIGKLSNPSGIAVDSEGLIYVADTGNDRIQMFSQNGSAVLAFGKRGSGMVGEFMGPAGVALDGRDFLYVADQDNNRVQTMHSSTLSLAPKDLLKPFGTAIGPKGELYVSNTGKHQIIVLNKSNGSILGTLGQFGSGSCQFDSPHGIAWDVANRLLYVADTGNNRVQVFGYIPQPQNAATPPAKPPENLVIPPGDIPKEPIVPPISVKPPAGPGPGAPGEPVTPPGPPGPPPVPDIVLSGVNAAPDPYDPFHGEVLTIAFALNKAANVTVMIYDKNMRLVYEAPQQGFPAGSSSIQWNGQSNKGVPIIPGTYRITIIANDGVKLASQTVEIQILNRGGH